VAERDGAVIKASGPRFMIQEENEITNTTANAVTEPPLLYDPSREDTTTQAVTTTTESLAVTTPSALPALTPIINETGTGGVVTLTLTAPKALAVAWYAIRVQASTPQFIGQARRLGDDVWQLTFDTTSLPAGRYLVYAKTKNANEVITSKEASLEVAPPLVAAPATPAISLPSVTDTAEAINELRAEDQLPLRSQYALPRPPVIPTPEIENSTPIVEPVLPERAVVPIVSQQLKDNEEVLNELLLRYASAYQSGDPIMLEVINAELEKERDRMVEKAALETAVTVSAVAITDSLTKEFAALTDSVETFEKLLKERSGNASASDRDQDGVSDYDEVAIYGTNPDLADTDGDGIPDGIEIMRGFNPLDSSPEVLMQYQTPKDFGLVRDDVLAVEAITPVIETDGDRGTDRVQAEIRGRALPNSFVTLFIYSDPIVVTVRTDADGSFVYQLDKELPDGAHQVYVAITDNAGDILAKSRPFTFVKEAEAFTPTVVSEPTSAVPVTMETAPDAAALRNTIAALGVLGFGLILLIFGLVIRRSPPTPVATENATPSVATPAST
jgi:hypothetical protein